MDIKPIEKNIRALLNAKNQYEIPRFQREYSWEKKHYMEFLQDMANNLEIKDKVVSTTPYFMGTMLFIADPEGPLGKTILVVDGQQRLTTITILFSAIARIFESKNQTILSKKVFEYIMSEDDNGNKVRVLKTVSSYPYFSFFIQSLDNSLTGEPASEEEKSIKQTYEYFYNQLSEDNIYKLFDKIQKDITGIPYIDLLKAIRDQILESSIIEIRTSSPKLANQLFEILNAKGKQLANIDLIKNKIFEYLDDTEPADFARETWKDITTILNSGEERTGIATFFRHHWSSKYNRTTAKNLYDDFKKRLLIKDYKNFLIEFHKDAKVYKKITNPSRNDYKNKKQYFWLVQSLNSMGRFFNVVQVRVPLLALYDAKERSLITTRQFKQVVTYLENFHFAYTAILSKNPNKIDSKYSKFSNALRNSNRLNAYEIINKLLYDELEKLFPFYDEFEKGFVKLSYSKKDSPLNTRTKYALYKLNSYYSNNELFDDQASVEHILPEGDSITLNIGNLIILEQNLNDEAGDLSYIDKLEVYKKSGYKWIKSFVEEHKEWNTDNVESRAKDLAKIYYEKVLGRRL